MRRIEKYIVTDDVINPILRPVRWRSPVDYVVCYKAKIDLDWFILLRRPEWKR